MMTLMRHTLISILFLIIPLVGCTKEPRIVEISAVAFNYSQDSIARLWVNGKAAGVGLHAAKLGEVKGGASVICCINLSPDQKMAEVKMQFASGEMFSLQAEVELPWPEINSYAGVHILPQRKVVIKVVSTPPEDERELLQARLKELGITAKIRLTEDIWAERDAAQAASQASKGINKAQEKK